MSYLPNPDDTKLFGLDVSYYQGQIDFAKMRAFNKPRVEFVAIRTGIGWGYTDPWFSKNWKEAKDVGIRRMAYHVVHPNLDPARQMDHFLKILGNDLGDGPLVLDVELDNGLTPKQISEGIRGCVDHLVLKTNRKPMIYSGPYFVKDNMALETWMTQIDWWIAQYVSRLLNNREHPGPVMDIPGIPKSRIKMHQTGDRCEGWSLGITNGNTVDTDRWLGTRAEFDALFSATPPPPPPPVDELGQWAAKMDALRNRILADDPGPMPS